MSDRTSLLKWQSITETLALVVVAGAVTWMSLSRSTAETAPTRPAAPTRRAEPKPPLEPISLAGAQILGMKTAKVALVVYSDFECPFCGKFARETLPALDAQYVKPGRVLIAFRQFPLPIHQFAVKAAEASECAGRQGKFWMYHDQLFANPKEIDPASLRQYARSIGLDVKTFDGCLNGQAASIVQADKASGSELQVTGTPSFLAGPILPDGRVRVSQRLSGAQPFGQFKDMLDRLIIVGDSARPGGQDK